MKQDLPLIWLASYPKSGNTWFRVFLANLLQEEKDKVIPVSINQLMVGQIASSRAAFDQVYGIDSSLLTLEEIDAKRPKLYKKWVNLDNDKTRFHKVHDAYTFLPNGDPLLGNPSQQKALYFIRNPLDVAVSFAYHSGYTDMNKMIEKMNEVSYAFCHRKICFYSQLRQQLLSWHEHVLSWIDQCKMPVHVMRYEDMVNDPISIFYKAIQFIGLSQSVLDVEKALELSSFSNLQSQEAQEGFKEKSPKTKAFFRKGKIGSYRESLTQEQIESLIQAHAKVMHRFGYLDNTGAPVF